MMPSKRVLVVGHCNCCWALSRLAPIDRTTVGDAERMAELKNAPKEDLDEFLSRVKVAVVHYTADGEAIFKRLANRSIPCVVILPEYYNTSYRRKHIRELTAAGAKAIFIEGFAGNMLMTKEFFRQIERFC